LFSSFGISLSSVTSPNGVTIESKSNPKDLGEALSIVVDSADSIGLGDSTDLEFTPLNAKRSLRQRFLAVIWDSLDKSHEEKKLIAKID
jgi:hypothetical protein